MTFITDYSQINAADDYQDWTYSEWSPTDNNSSATTPIYIEGAACQWWPMSKGVTGGYTYCTATGSVAGRLAVVWSNLAYADISNIPVTQLRFRLCSTSWTSNYDEWDMLAQIASPLNIPISGHTPVLVYPTNPDASNGTFNTASLSQVGMIGTTGGTNDGKQGGYDMVFLIGYVGYHSETRTNTYFSGLYAEAYDSNGGGLPGTNNRPLGILSRSGNFYQTNVNFQVGDSAQTVNTVVSETGKTIFFNNVEPEHNLGYIFEDAASYSTSFTLISCGNSWNQQSGTSPEIFTDMSNADIFRVDGCTFSNGGAITCRAAVSDADTYFKNCTVDNCHSVDPNTMLGTNNNIKNYEQTVDTSAMIWNTNTSPTGRIDGTSFTKGTAATHAIEFGTSSPLTMTLTDITVSGYNASDAQNDSTLHIKRTSGDVSITLDGCTGTFSYKSAGANVTIISGAVSATQTVTTTGGTPIQSARVFIEAKDATGPFPFEESVTITRVSTTASVAHTAHGMASGDKVSIDGADQLEYNVSGAAITNVTTNAYDFTVSGTPTTPATGTITSTYVALEGLTDVNGEITMSRVFTSNQPITGWARKGSSSPFYKEASINGTIDSGTGYSGSAPLVLDE